MSGLGFAERVKLLLQKRLDTTKWPIGDSPPGGLRYLSDGQGNLIALVTTSVNPNDPQPIGPGSNEAAAETDPVLNVMTKLNIPITFTKLTNPVLVNLQADLATGEEIMTLESPRGTDYSVPAGKKLILFHALYSAAGVTVLALGYGSDGVAAGGVLPSDPVGILGKGDVTSGQTSSLYVTTSSVPYSTDIFCEVPASQFPFCNFTSGAFTKDCQLTGLEVTV